MRLATGLALATGFILGSAALAAEPDPLQRYRGTARVLVLSAPDPADPHLLRQRAELDADRAGSRERDLVVVEAIGAERDALAIRRHLRLPADMFRAVLIGKDGSAKITTDAPIAAQRVFTTIDAMPMRRDEIWRRR